MTNKFFEGKDFKKGEFKALDPKFYTEKYRRYIDLEKGCLTSNLIFSEKPAKRVLEAGAGTGRLIPVLAPLCEELICVDNSRLMLKMAKKSLQSYEKSKSVEISSLGDNRMRVKLVPNRKNVTITYGNLEELSKKFPAKHFDFSCCVWNTLGNVKDDALVLRELAAVTGGKVLISVHLKGAIEERKAWYSAVGVAIEKIDKKTETVYTESGLVSKAYSPSELEKMAKNAGLSLDFGAVLNEVVFWAELSRR